jgi:threonine synthase
VVDFGPKWNNLMQYYSTNNPNHRVSLSEAVIKGLAPDNGLYMPERIPVLPKEFIERLPELSFREIGYAVIGALFSEDLRESRKMCTVWNFFMAQPWLSKTLGRDFAPS